MSHPLHSFFSKIPLFASLDAEDLTDLLRTVHPVECPAGHVLFKLDDPGDSAFIIENGRIEILIPDGESLTAVTELSSGELFGELALLDGKPRSATARAMIDSKLLRIDQREFDFLRRNLRPAAYKLIRGIAMTVSNRIRMSNDHIAEVLRVDDPDSEREQRSSWIQRLFKGGNK